jgi:hypothetical protein
MADTSDVVGALVAALVELPMRLARIEAQQRQILARMDALAGALAPVDLVAAAPVLGKSVATLRRLAGAGKLPGAIRIGRSWRVALGAVRPPTPEHVGTFGAAARPGRPGTST